MSLKTLLLPPFTYSCMREIKTLFLDKRGNCIFFAYHFTDFLIYMCCAELDMMILHDDNNDDSCDFDIE